MAYLLLYLVPILNYVYLIRRIGGRHQVMNLAKQDKYLNDVDDSLRAGAKNIIP